MARKAGNVSLVLPVRVKREMASVQAGARK